MATVYLARHGETDWNARGKLQGRTDIPLNDRGLAQARTLAGRLANLGLTAVVTSDLVRARSTGDVVAETLGIAARSIDPGLKERSFGVFEGLTRDECAARHPEAWKAWLEQTAPPDGAEAREAAVARLTRALTRIVAEAREGPSLAISHGGIMRLWLMDLLGTPVPLIGNGAVYEVEREGVRFRATLLVDL
jgi:broad specificity phosphatase PhoE